jgi:hypothetical protein
MGEPPMTILFRTEHNIPGRFWGELSFWNFSDKNSFVFWPFPPQLFFPLAESKSFGGVPGKTPGLYSPQGLTIRFRSSALYDIDSLQTFLSLGDFKLNFIPFMKDLETILFNERKVHE